jgi:hypothetical protein
MQHQDLTKDRWANFTLREQLANVGSEVIRAVNWQKKGNIQYATLAFYRALELIDLTLAKPLPLPELSEIARLREVLVDYFGGGNIYQSSEASWKSYFQAFTLAAALEREKT